MADLPTGTVTFLFTDLEGSTRLLEAHPEAYRAAVHRHHELLLETVEVSGGVVFETVGDAVYAAFARPTGAATAALRGQLALQGEDWGETPLRVRMGVHLGEVEAYPVRGAARGARYFGVALVRCARLMAVAHGGQVVLSAAVAEQVRDALPAGARLVDLGDHRLKDLQRDERVFQLAHPDLLAAFPPLRSLNPRRHNLPVQPTPFVGRAADLEAVRRRLLGAEGEGRLLTLTGPGGTGKTRLALQAAVEVLDDPDADGGPFPDGVWLVALAPLSDPELVPGAIAQALGIREAPGASLGETLARHLEDKRLLLVLDNFEHVAAAAPGVADLLAAAPGLRVLVTSRAALHLAAEREYPVAPLALPDPERPLAPEALTRYEAVALFVQRARAVKPDFAVTRENAPAVAAICARVDGLPLALELAAGRVKLLPPRALLARLGSRLRVLTGGSRDAPARQRTLRAAIDWSFSLLEPGEQALFARLAVFAGGWTLDAAEGVCGAGDDAPVDVLDGLGSLVDKSLVRQEELPDGEARFALLETIREFALERLAAAGEAAPLRRRHAAYYLALAEAAEPHLEGPDQGAWAARLEREHDNLRAALAWAREDGDAATGQRLAGALWRFWDARGYLTEGRRWLREVSPPPIVDGAAGPAGPAAQAKVLAGAALLAIEQGDYDAAAPLCARSIALARARGERRDLVVGLNAQGRLARERGRYDEAVPSHEAALAIAHEDGNKAGAAAALAGLAIAASLTGDAPRARTLAEQSLAVFRALGDAYGQAGMLYDLAWQAAHGGAHERAEALGGEALALFRALGETGKTADALFMLGTVAQQQGQHVRAATLHEESLALRLDRGDRRGAAQSLTAVGAMALQLEDLARARALLTDALATFRQHDDRWGLAMALTTLGHVELAAGDAARARPLFGEGAALFRAIGNPLYLPWCVEGLAGVAAARGDPALAARLDGARDALCARARRPLPPAHPAGYARTVAAVHAALGEEPLAAARAAGAQRPLEELIAEALAANA